MAKKKTALDFEQSLHTLEQLVESMEGGDMTLEKSLEAFEQGIKLTKECQQALREAEQKVEILLGKNGEETLQPFQEAGNETDEESQP
jgi:exodeoxyribonuclease VII small subunit